MSDAVERRILTLLEKPLLCPHGNPIPGLEELGLPFATADSNAGDLVSLARAVSSGPTTVIVDRISEQLQPDAGLMKSLFEAGLRPGNTVQVAPHAEGVEVGTDGARTPFRRTVAEHIFVRVA